MCVKMCVFLTLFLLSVNVGEEFQESSIPHIGQGERIAFSQNVDCGPAFRDRQKGQPQCFPKECGRVVIDNFATKKEVEVLKNMAEFFLSPGSCESDVFFRSIQLMEEKSEGGDNLLRIGFSQGNEFEELAWSATDEEVETYYNIRNRIRSFVSGTFAPRGPLYPDDPAQFMSYVRPLQFNSRLSGYGYATPHIDIFQYPRLFFTTVLILTERDQDFGGGDFIFFDHKNGVNVSIQGKAGRLVAFTSGDENPHEVEAIEWGVRFALLFGWECAPGMLAYISSLACSNPKVFW